MAEKKVEDFAALCAWRGVANWDQLAIDSGVSVRSLFNIRHGIHYPTAGNRALLMVALDVSEKRLKAALLASRAG